eukprot:gene7780-967_t
MSTQVETVVENAQVKTPKVPVPVETTKVEPTQVVGLKRLRSASLLASNAISEAERIYKYARGLTPAFLESSVSWGEDTVVAVTAPVVAKAQDAGDKLLHFVDSKIDYTLITADEIYTKTLSSVLSLHQSNMKSFTTASEKYFTFLMSTANWVVDRLNPIKGVKAARATLASALETAKEASDPDVAVTMAADAWAKFSAHPAVSKMLTTAAPVTTYGYATFNKVHDNVVVSSLYKKVLDTTASTLGYATTTTPYRLGVSYLYPFIQPYSEPALDTVSKSKVVNEVMDFWKPVTGKPLPRSVQSFIHCFFKRLDPVALAARQPAKAADYVQEAPARAAEREALAAKKSTELLHVDSCE